MKNFGSTLLALVAAPLLAFAQNPNNFNNPAGGYNATAGDSLDLSWNPSTSGTVSLFLRRGASSNLENLGPIVENITNSGSYTWDIPEQTVFGSQYSIEIVSDEDNSEADFTPFLVINSDVTTEPITSSSTTTGTSVTTTTDGTSTSESTTTTTGTSPTTSGSTTSQSTTSSSSSGAGFQSTATNGATTTTAPNAGPRATAAAGMIGLVALGAMAL